MTKKLPPHDRAVDVIDVTPAPVTPAKKGKVGLFRRLVITLVIWLPTMFVAYAWDAFVHPTRADSTFLWELGYRLGSTTVVAPLVGFLIAWILIPFAFSPDK